MEIKEKNCNIEIIYRFLKSEGLKKIAFEDGEIKCKEPKEKVDKAINNIIKYIT